MIYSMTAFATSSIQGEWGQATWEIKSINHRYLDVQIKIPESIRYLEAQLRDTLRTKLNRGRIECFLQYKPTLGQAVKLSLNKELLQELSKAIDEIGSIIPSAKICDPLKVLSWPEVLQTTEENKETILKLIASAFEKALDDLIKTRAREGAALKIFIEEKLPEIATLTKKIRSKFPHIIAVYREKLIKHLAEINEIKRDFDHQRLEQELVLFAQKIDVTEELDRIDAHVKEINRMLQAGGHIGKNIDFILQELTREANTLAAKSADIEMSNAATTIKILVEQIREQTQNLE